MIIKENLIIKNKPFVKQYSDKNLKIRQIETDVLYDEAIDVENSTYTYEETNIPIEEEEDEYEEN
jgi:hypothetical protein